MKRAMLILAASLSCSVAFAELQPMSDEALSAVSGQGPSAGLLDPENEAIKPEEFMDLAGIMDEMFDYNLSVTNVIYGPLGAGPFIHDNGRIEMAFPERIGQISLTDLKVAGGDQPLGSLYFTDIRFHGNSSLIIQTQ